MFYFNLFIAICSSFFLFFYSHQFIFFGIPILPSLMFLLTITSSYVHIFSQEWKNYEFKFLLFSNSLIVVLTSAFISNFTWSIFLNNSYKLVEFKLPFLLELLITFIIFDFFQYIFHKMQHNNKFLWSYHSYHHTLKKSNWLDAQRLHIFEFLVPYFFATTVCYIFGFGYLSESIYKIFAISLFAVYSHSGFMLNENNILKSFFVSAEFHLQHHKKLKGNYSAFLSIFWDKIFKTDIGFIKKEKELNYPGLKIDPTLKRTIESLNPLGHKIQNERVE